MQRVAWRLPHRAAREGREDPADRVAPAAAPAGPAEQHPEPERRRTRLRALRRSSPATTRRKPISRHSREPASQAPASRHREREHSRSRETRITRHPDSRRVSRGIRKLRPLEARQPSLRVAQARSRHRAVSSLRIPRLLRQAAVSLQHRCEAWDVTCCNAKEPGSGSVCQNVSGSVCQCVSQSGRAERLTD
jgi:hypothetical protein